VIKDGPRVRLNEEWGKSGSYTYRPPVQLQFPFSQRRHYGWPVGTLATVVGGSQQADCVTVIKDGGKTRTVFNVRFLEPLTMQDRLALARIAYPVRLP
jgi:hypothetical protein